MAIFHLNTSTISRKSGRTSTAAAAYRCGGILYDERTDKTHDYSKKKGVVFTTPFYFYHSAIYQFHPDIFLPRHRQPDP